MTQKPNSITHVEFHSNAPEKTRSFLQNVFGWKFEDIPGPQPYAMFKAPSEPGGGLSQAETLPAGILNYVLSTDIENHLNKIRMAGGSIMTPKTEIPGFGWFAVFQDPTGINLALYEAAPRPRQAPARKIKATKSRARGAMRSPRRRR
jgi:predicted enzyme related to lactoylglutathione lyase